MQDEQATTDSAAAAVPPLDQTQAAPAPEPVSVAAEPDVAEPVSEQVADLPAVEAESPVDAPLPAPTGEPSPVIQEALKDLAAAEPQEAAAAPADATAAAVVSQPAAEQTAPPEQTAL